MAAGTLFVVATPIGNLEDITGRAVRILREVSLIAAEDTRRTAKLLARYGISTPTTSLHEHNEYDKAARLLDRLANGENVALVSDAGTPTVSDPGSHLVAEAIARGFRVEPIPGPNAAVTALSASGLHADSFVFLGFPPNRSKDRKSWFDRLGTCGLTVVFHESPHHILRTLDELMSRFGDIEVVIGRELTKTHEEFIRGPISLALKTLQPPIGEFTIVARIGRKTEYDLPKPPSGQAIAFDFGVLTNNNGFTRRQAIAALSKRHRISAKEIYRLLEESKSSVG